MKAQLDNWHRARSAAQAILYGPAETRLARHVLNLLRAEIAAGVPHRALLDRVDDELFKLDKRKETR
jgi:hypothetical protein